MTRLEQAHAALLRDRSFQWDFPAAVPPRPPSWLKPLADFLQRIGPAATWVFWIVVGLGALALLVVVGRELLRGGGGVRRGLQLQANGLAPAPAKARALLAEADALAAQGGFGEAVHLLLLRTLEDLDARRPGLLRPALTAREIAALPAVPEPVRSPLSRIARAVEAHLFAGLPTPPETWQAARGDYEAFLRAAAA